MHRDGCVLILYTGADSGPVAAIARWVEEGDQTHPGACVSLMRATDVSEELARRSGAVVLGTGDFHGHPEPELFAFAGSTSGAERASLLDGAVSAGFCATTGAGQHLLEGVARSTVALGAVFIGGAGIECAQGLVGQVEAAGGSWEWRAEPAQLRVSAQDLGRRVADVAAFYPSCYDRARVQTRDMAVQGMTPYWLVFWISLALIAVVFLQRN
jgi:hypothetical protein